MTDQDPTQAYQPPAQPSAAPPEPPAPPAPPAAALAAPPPPLEFPASVPTSPVTSAPVAARPGRSRVKWLVAALVTLLVAGAAAGGTLLLTSQAGDAAVMSWTPADSVAYAELRLDLPGSQGAELAKAMQAFPGFKDQAAFPVKMSEVLDRLAAKASGGKQSYKTDIEPWFGGQVGGSVGPLPAKADAAAARALLLASVKDATKAAAWADSVLKENGATGSTSDYNGVTITTITPPAGAAAKMAGATAAYAVLGPVLAIGDVASVKAAIDTKGKTGLPTNAQFKTAEASVPGDRLGFAYVDTAAIVKGAAGLAGAAASAMPQLPSGLQDWTAPWAAAAISAKDGAFYVDTRAPRSAKAGPAKNAESKVPGLVPPTTVVLVDGHDVGASLATLKNVLASDPQLKDGVKQLDDALALVGGFDAATGWIGEAGIAITRAGDKVSGGLVIVPADKAAADRLLSQLKAFTQLAGVSASEEAYGGTTITTLDLSGLAGLAAGAAGMATLPKVDLKISYAVTDEVVVIGASSDFVKGVLDARSGADLAQTDRFQTALARTAKVNSGLLWVDAAAVRGMVEAQVPAADRAGYDANVKPYLQALDTVIGTMVAGDIDSGTIVLGLAGG
jgi:hypothetical protein